MVKNIMLVKLIDNFKGNPLNTGLIINYLHNDNIYTFDSKEVADKFVNEHILNKNDINDLI
jgi:hypothetical protein